MKDTTATFAQVCYFPEWRSWGVTLYDDAQNRARDADGRDIEADWHAKKFDAEVAAYKLLEAGEIDRVEVFTKAGAHASTRARVRPSGRNSFLVTTDHPEVTQ